ncbi:MAG TPA: DUF2298 domain-containing protein, partial [Aggregatilineales bacterium]|nr:DUF2298 domain-containing protein [Aggregatilineales bacterium]
EMAGAATSIFDTECSTYYPPNAGNGLYVYGELPLFVVKATAYLVQQQALSNAQSIGDPVGRGQAIQSANYVTTYYGVQVVGRMVSTLAELFSIFFVFLIGRRLYNRWTGLLAAALYAAAVLPIQLSHFWTADAFTNLPVVITFWFATRILDRARWYDFLGAGVALGASFASRINTLPLFGVVVLAAMIYALPYLAGATVRVDWWKVLRRSLVSLVFIAIIVFLLLLMNHVLANFGLPDAAQKILLGAGIVALALIYLFFVSPAINFNPLPGRAWLWQRLLLGCLVAFIATLVTFRFAYPHAFTGGPGLLGFFNITPYSTFLNNMSEAQRLTSGAVDFPPAHQWANRAPYLFALDNIVLWGLGVPLGLMAWFGFLWAALQVLRARPGWTRHALPVAWIAVYFGYMGRQWVMTMRYFMPIYPFLALMAAWALVEIAVRAWRWSAENGAVLRRAAAVGGTLLLVGVLVLTYVWADMFVSIYRRELTRVEASRWVQREAPSPVSTTLTTSDGQTRLVNLRLPGGAAVTVTAYDTPAPRLVAFTPQAVGSIDHVIISHLADPDHKGDVKRFNVTVALNNDGSKVIAHGSIQANFGAQASSLGDPVTVRLDQPVMLNPTEQYYFMTWSEGRLSVVRTATDLADFTVADGQGNAVAQVKLPEQADTRQASAYLSGQPLDANFSAPLDGMIDHFDLTHALNPLRDGSTVNLNISLYDATSNTLLSQGTLSADISTTKSSPDGDAYRIPLDKPVTVKAGQALRFEIAASGQEPVQIAGTAIASEGPWDDPIPWKVCPLPADMPLTHDTPPNVLPITCDSVDGFDGWYRGLALNMADEDDQTKQASIQSALDQADYFIISSNRFYDSEARIPMRYPMSIAFYKALFAGQTGFDLVKTVSSFPSLGSFEIPDQNLPIYNTPSWVKEFQSEEAFSVYDHPTVFIFKKNANYSSQALAKILNVPNATIDQVSLREDTVSSQDPTLVNRITFSAADPGPALNGFQLTDDQRAIQTQGGTWSDLFNRNWTINTSPIIAVVAWWLAILLIGLAAWPLVFVVLPGLPDRGYPIAKIIGLLIVAWVAWAGGTLHLLTWTQGGLFLITLALIAVGIVLAWRHREAMRDYVRANWRHMLIVELITLILFLAFVFVRLGNPDLWAQVLGGEKPMDFAYFNAVLRSTIFPPYDPWYAGGYLNYYYFGYVLIGSPVKLLGVMPSIAYNLVVPTLFALTGIGAFCVAFNLAASRIFFPRDEGQDGGQDVPLRARRRFAMRVPAASPYLAGALALILCLILGNLDTPRTFIGGVTQAGGYAQDTQAFLNWKIQQFTKANGHQPSADEMLLLTGEASNPSVPDQIGFALSDTGRLLSSISGGIVSIARGGILPVDPNRWFWAARSVVGEMPNSSNEINEFPYFTFVYGDLHAHMMAFPLTLLALAWLLSEVLGAGYIRRTTALSIGVALLGGLIVGALQATNTWDWLT